MENTQPETNIFNAADLATLGDVGCNSGHPNQILDKATLMSQNNGSFLDRYGRPVEDAETLMFCNGCDHLATCHLAIMQVLAGKSQKRGNPSRLRPLGTPKRNVGKNPTSQPSTPQTVIGRFRQLVETLHVF